MCFDAATNCSNVIKLVIAHPNESIYAGFNQARVFDEETQSVSEFPLDHKQIMVNGEEISKLTIDKQQRSMYTVNVPGSVGEVSEISVKLLNESDCKSVDDNFIPSSNCQDRTVILRSLFLNDEKLENPEASGNGNLASLIKKSEGGITWKVAQ